MAPARRRLAGSLGRLAGHQGLLAFVSALVNGVWYCALVLLAADGALQWPVGWWTWVLLLTFWASSLVIWFIDHVVDADGSGT